ncbi:tyrosine phosphatase [Klebsormidium nitens]|uniref:protein-tyrosine-phosphatase n=1 Tax=Klebsormidium nitens TaxID=105231 RepID=A0A1Y1IKQ0_KLENI|nr:tyrosine phosphatase [Klebsormidium nitens]|eukprot:GAQ89721.1 tyrosine phosphatase [Klebsormidium nitens]
MGGSHAASPTTPSPVGTFSLRKASFEEDPVKLTPVELENCKAALAVLQERLRVHDGVEHEYSALQAETITSSLLIDTEVMQCARDPANSKKNRYLDVLPFDDNRVLLQPESSNGEASDYINASYVYDSDRPDLPKYIATQGPLPATTEDFWAMVIQQRCQAIISLTREVERDRPKCAHYFPEAAGQAERYGHIVVATREVTYLQQGLIARRMIEVASTASASPPLVLPHYHYLDWPDHGVPASTSVIRGLLRHLRLSLPPSSPPIVIHCSAGIGRSGTFLTVDYTVRRALSGDLSAMDIAETVKKLRALRGGMVQTRDQYRFCYIAVREELEDLVAWGSG